MTSRIYARLTVITVVVSCLAGVCAQSAAEGAENWWNLDWQYRVPVLMVSQDHARTSYPIILTLDYDAMLPEGQSFDVNSVRVVETRDTGVTECMSHYDPVAGSTAWIMSGTTLEGEPRYFDVYFGSIEDGPKPHPTPDKPRFLHGNTKTFGATGEGWKRVFLHNLLDYAVSSDVISSFEDTHVHGQNWTKEQLANLPDSDFGILMWDTSDVYLPNYDESIAMFVAQGGKVVVADGGIHWTRESYYGWEPPGTHPSGTQVHEVLTEIFPVTVSHYLPYTGRWPHRWGTNIGFPTPFTPSEPFDLSNTNTYFWWYRNPAGVWSMAYEGGEPWLLDNGLDFGYEPRVRSVAEGYHALVGSAFCYQLALADWPEHKSGYGKYLINCLNFSGMADPPEIEIGEVESQNTPPVADASATPIEVISPNNVDAIVTLDGSRSFDLDEDPLDFFWFADEDLVTPIATTEIATVPLGVGVHDILLVVDDSIDTADDLITVNVITASEGTQDLSDLVSDLSIPAGTQSQLNASLEAASASFDRQNMTAGVNQLQAFQNKVAAQAGKKIDPLTAALLIEEAQRIIDAVSGG